MTPADDAQSFRPAEPRQVLELLAADPSISPYFREGLFQELVAIRIHEREAQRSSGVCWSGMGVGWRPARSVAEIARDAAEAQAKAEAYATSNTGKANKAAADLQRLCEAIHAAAQDVRDAISRQDGSAPRSLPASTFAMERDLRLRLQDLDVFLTLAEETV